MFKRYNKFVNIPVTGRHQQEEASMIRGAIFDMDGLLLDSECIWQKGWYEIAGEMGISLPDTFTSEVCGTSGPQMETVIRRSYRVDDPRPIMASCQERVYRYEEEGVPLKPGAEEILSGMKSSGLLLAVGSSSPIEMIRKNLEKAGILTYFDVLTSGREAAHPKPAPDIFLLAAKKLGLSPEECYVFEDSPSGVEAGCRAGCVTVMIPDMVKPTDEVRARCSGIYPSLSDAWRAINDNKL